jgi:hypothetical protein
MMPSNSLEVVWYGLGMFVLMVVVLLVAISISNHMDGKK